MPVNFCLLKVDLPLHNLARWSRWLDFQMENRQHNGEFNIKLLSCHLTAQTSYFGLMECCQLPHTPLLSLENKELFFNGKDFFFKHDIPFLKAVFPVCNHFNVCILYMHSHIPPCYFYQGNISISILLMGLPFTFCFRWPYIWNKGSVNCHCQWCSPRLLNLYLTPFCYSSASVKILYFWKEGIKFDSKGRKVSMESSSFFHHLSNAMVTLSNTLFQEVTGFFLPAWIMPSVH